MSLNQIYCVKCHRQATVIRTMPDIHRENIKVIIQCHGKLEALSIPRIDLEQGGTMLIGVEARRCKT